MRCSRPWFAPGRSPCSRLSWPRGARRVSPRARSRCRAAGRGRGPGAEAGDHQLRVRGGAEVAPLDRGASSGRGHHHRRSSSVPATTVSSGTPILQIDAAKQQATVQSEQAGRAAQEAAVRYAEQQFERAKQLLGVGAISHRSTPGRVALRTAKASWGVSDARVRENQVQLRYFRVAAPAAGVVGDIPVRSGDRVKTGYCADDHRSERRPRGLRPGADRALTRHQAGPARAAARHAGKGGGGDHYRFRFPAGGRSDPVDSRQGAGPDGQGVPQRSVRAGAGDLARRARADDPRRRRDAHQRPVLSRSSPSRPQRDLSRTSGR